MGNLSHPTGKDMLSDRLGGGGEEAPQPEGN